MKHLIFRAAANGVRGDAPAEANGVRGDAPAAYISTSIQISSYSQPFSKVEMSM